MPSEQALTLLETLVGFDTVSARPNLALARFIEEHLARFDITAERVPSPDGTKTALMARIGPEARGGVVLSAHTDVVPVAGQCWSHDPFTLRVADGRAHGRGACDMKGFLACVLAATEFLAQCGLKAPVYFAFSYDEEIGCAGVRPMIEHLRSRAPQLRACIVGEPSSMQPVTAHTGKQLYECTFHGTPMHSSLSPRGTNAIAEAGDAIARLNGFASGLPAFPTADQRFPIAHPTVNIGTIDGGSAPNIVAEHCRFQIEYRHPPGTPADLLCAEFGRMNTEQPEWFDVREVVAYPAFQALPASDAVHLVSSVQSSAEARAVNYGTEAGLYMQAGIDTVVLGPGDIAQAHQPDEHIELSQLAACEAFLRRLGQVLASDGTIR